MSQEHTNTMQQAADAQGIDRPSELPIDPLAEFRRLVEAKYREKPYHPNYPMEIPGKSGLVIGTLEVDDKYGLVIQKENRGKIWLVGRNYKENVGLKAGDEVLMQQEEKERSILHRKVCMVKVDPKILDVVIDSTPEYVSDGTFRISAFVREDRTLGKEIEYPDKPDAGNEQHDSRLKDVYTNNSSTTAHHLVRVEVELSPESYKIDPQGYVIATCKYKPEFTRSLGPARNFNTQDVFRLRDVPEAAKAQILEARLVYLKENYPQRYRVEAKGYHKKEEPMTSYDLSYSVCDRWNADGANKRDFGSGNREAEGVRVRPASYNPYNLVQQPVGLYIYDDREILSRFAEIENLEAIEEYFIARRQGFETELELSETESTERIYHNPKEDPSGLSRLDRWSDTDEDHWGEDIDDGYLESQYLVRKGNRWYMVTGKWKREGEIETYWKTFYPIPEPPALEDVLDERQREIFHQRKEFLQQQADEKQRAAGARDQEMAVLNTKVAQNREERRQERWESFIARGGSAPMTLLTPIQARDTTVYVNCKPPTYYRVVRLYTLPGAEKPTAAYEEVIQDRDPVQAKTKAEYWLETHRVANDGSLEMRITIPTSRGGGYEWEKIGGWNVLANS